MRFPLSSARPISLPLPRSSRLLTLVVVTGLFGGVVGALYLEVLWLMTDRLGPDGSTDVQHLGVLVAVGVLIGLLVRYVGAPPDVELLVDNIHVSGGNEEMRGLRSLIPVSLLSIAAGGTLGPEAPLVTTTGTLGTVLGRRSTLTTNQVRVVTITGMAAGFTVLFGAPLGSAVFALEILHRRGMEYYEALLPAIVGSLCGWVVASAVGTIGLEPLWTFPPLTELASADIGWSVVAGAAGAAVAVSFTYLSIGLRRLIGVIPVDARPALGGVALGLAAMVSPYALTNGELQIEHMTPTTMAAGTLLLAAGIKLLAAAVSLVSGWRGGFIIPLFFVGYCLGRAAHGHLPGAHEWAFVAGMMVAANVGVTKTPLGSTLVITEMAGLTLLPTTLIAAIVSLVLTSGVGLIHSQRQRFAVSDEGSGAHPEPDAPEPATRVEQRA